MMMMITSRYPIGLQLYPQLSSVNKHMKYPPDPLLTIPQEQAKVVGCPMGWTSVRLGCALYWACMLGERTSWTVHGASVREEQACMKILFCFDLPQDC
jgi:hypothetical protein